MRRYCRFPSLILLLVSVSLAGVETSLAGTTVSLNPPSLAFAYAMGGSAPPSQSVMISSANPSQGVDFYIARSQNCNWLALNAMAGTTPATLTATVNTGMLATGAFFCYLTVTAVGTAGPLSLEVTLSVFDRPPITISPASLAFTASGQNQLPPPQGLFLFAGAPVDFFATPTTASGGAWLAAGFSGTTPTAMSISVNPAGLLPGVYKGAIKISSPSANPTSQSVPVTLTVPSPVTSAPLAASPEAFTFSFARGSQDLQTRYLTIAGPSTYEASADVEWLNVTPAQGTVAASASSVVSISGDPRGRDTGTYTGNVTVSRPDGSTIQSAFAAMTIGANAQSLVLSQTGLSFRTCASGKTAPPQTVSISNGGSGTLPWSLAPSTLSGGNWLSALPTSGTANGTPSTVTLQVSPAGLTPGDYYGQLRIDAPGADNSPQFVGVVLTVSSSGNVTATVDPIGLIFTATPGDPAPASQTVTVTNRAASPLGFESGAFFGADPAWFTVLPPAGIIDVGQNVQITIQPTLSGLLQGVLYQGELNLGFSDRSAQKIHMSLSTLPVFGRCACTSLIPMITCLGGDTALTLGRSVGMGIKVLDNCGETPQGDGSMELQFSNGEPAIPLVPLGDGTWQGTFTPTGTEPGDFQIHVQGVIGSVPVLPNALSVSAAQVSTQPLVLPHGVSSAASYSAYAPIAPGSLINIYGNNLALTQASYSLPFPLESGGTEVRLAGQAMPLLFVSGNRIIAQVPYPVAVNTTQQLVVKQNSMQSAPETLAVAPAQPALFTVNEQGSGQAVVTVGDSAVLADASHPVKAGDLIVIHCSGLGAVSPAVAAGAPAPSQPLSRTTAVPTVTLDGIAAEVLFSGLTPGYAGLYQINAIVPAGIPPGGDVPVLLSIAGQASPAATIAVR